ncbi:TB2/DP1 HVA22 [Gracilaria domingensis]|nr:TB2/DP1 HVA22 [Gracilaria domingensis]
MRTRSSRFRFFTDALASNAMPLPDMSDLMRQAPTTDPNRPTRRPSRRTSHSSPSQNPFETDSSLHSNHVPSFLRSNSAEESSDLMMRNIVLGATLLMAMFMFLHAALYVGIFLVGVLMPAWRTWKCMEGRSSSNVLVELLDDDSDSNALNMNGTNLRDVGSDQSLRNWQSYWIIFALLFTFDSLFIRSVFSASSFITSPFHNTIAFALLSWLSKSGAANSAALYSAFVRPTFLKLEDSVDSMAANAMIHMDRASQQVIVSVHEAIAPVVRQLEQAATATATQMQQQKNARHVKPRQSPGTR